MICVTIGRGRHSSLVEEWKSAAEAGVELVELRIDCLRREPDLKRILKERPTPLVFTIRRGVDGGLWRGNEEKRQQILREAVALGVDYIDLEMDIASKIRRFGKTKRIVSYHNMKTTPVDLQDIAEKCEEFDPDVVKIATSATTLAEASRVLHLGATAKAPTIPIAMGEIGVFTRILGRKFGAPFTYAGFNPERVFAAGMLQYGVVRKITPTTRSTPRPRSTACIGDPIEQSSEPRRAQRRLSPARVEQGDGAVPGARRRAAGLLQGAALAGHQGMQRDDSPQGGDRAALAAEGRCRRAHRHLQHGHLRSRWAAAPATTPTIGRRWIRSKPAMGGRVSEEAPSPLFDKQVLILGAGGVARSIAFGLTRRGAHVTITNRHDERATRLAEEVGCRTVTWSMRASTVADVIINATPVGMHPNVDDTPLPPRRSAGRESWSSTRSITRRTR